MLLDGENQCGDDLDDWFHFALNIVVSVIPIVCYKDGYGPKGYRQLYLYYGGAYGHGFGAYGWKLYYGKQVTDPYLSIPIFKQYVQNIRYMKF